MFVGLPKILPLDGVCRGCILGNYHQALLNSRTTWHVQKQLELVCSDLCYMNKPSLVGVNYILIFNDDLSRFTWVYFLKNKNLVI